MTNRKATFAKRQRETDLKDKARQKAMRREQKRTEVRVTKGPEIAWDEAVHETDSGALPPTDAPPTDDKATPSPDPHRPSAALPAGGKPLASSDPHRPSAAAASKPVASGDTHRHPVQPAGGKPVPSSDPS